MKYFFLSGPINPELLDKFIPFFNSHQQEDCTIILNTVGGSYYVGEVLQLMIGQMPKATLVIQAAYSEGLKLAYFATCPKLLSAAAKGMWHYGSQDVTMNVKNQPQWNEDKCSIKNFDNQAKDDYALAKKIMTPKELAEFQKDEQVFFDVNRMSEIFPEATIIKSKNNVKHSKIKTTINGQQQKRPHKKQGGTLPACFGLAGANRLAPAL